MGIEDILENYHTKSAEFQRKGTDLKAIVDEFRVTRLLDFYEKGLGDEDKSKFKALSRTDQIAKLREKNYKIKDEYATQLVNELSEYVLSLHGGNMAKDFKKARETLADSSKSVDEKREAAHQLENLKVILKHRFGLDADALEKVGKERGFSEEIFNHFTQQVGQAYISVQSDSYKVLIGDEEAKSYLKKIDGMKHDYVISKGPDEVKDVVFSHYIAKKTGDMNGFKKRFHYYH